VLRGCDILKIGEVLLLIADFMSVDGTKKALLKYLSARL
jgi:hypothetical protein